MMSRTTVAQILARAILVALVVAMVGYGGSDDRGEGELFAGTPVPMLYGGMQR